MRERSPATVTGGGSEERPKKMVEMASFREQGKGIQGERNSRWAAHCGLLSARAPRHLVTASWWTQRQRARREDKRPRVLWGGASSGLLPCLGWPVGSRPRKAPMLCVHGCCVEGACMSVPGPQKELPTGHQLPTSGDCRACHLSSLAGRSILCIYVMRHSVPGVTPSPTGPRTPRSAEPTPVRPALRGGAASGHDYGTRMCCPHSHEA